jgi:hypothetical protein
LRFDGFAEFFGIKTFGQNAIFGLRGLVPKAFFGHQKVDRLVSIFEIKNQLRQQNADIFPVFLQA